MLSRDANLRTLKGRAAEATRRAEERAEALDRQLAERDADLARLREGFGAMTAATEEAARERVEAAVAAAERQ
eukprot:3619269-Pyramimonas_sp.AAC.1